MRGAKQHEEQMETLLSGNKDSGRSSLLRNKLHGSVSNWSSSCRTKPLSLGSSWSS